MAKNKITYQNWIVDIGYDPIIKPESFDNRFTEISLEQLIQSDYNPDSPEDSSSSNKDAIIKAVRHAIAKLSPDEQEFICRFYYMGERYNSLSEKSNKEIYKLNALHKQIIKKLKISLHTFVKEHFDVDTDLDLNCIICNSKHLVAINKLIKNRNKKTTWTNVIKRLKQDYNIQITTPQTLIGHEKYHM